MVVVAAGFPDDANWAPSRRDVLRWAGAGGLSVMAASVLGGALGACSARSHRTSSPAGRAGSTGGKGSNDTIRVGVVTPLGGLGAFIGSVTESALHAAVQQVNATGGVGGRKVELVVRDAGSDPQQGIRAYQEMAGDANLVGILWCGGLGYDESKTLIARDHMPSIAVFDDDWSGDDMYPKKPERRPIFQLLVPDRMAIDALCRYAKDDRGYTTIGLLYDSILSSDIKRYYNDSVKAAGLTSVAAESYTVLGSEYGPQLQKLRAARPQTLMVWGLAKSIAGIVQQIDQLGATYVDAPTAKAASGWHPQLLGAPEGTGDHTWADLAGPAARIGTVTAWHVGGLTYLPDFAIRDWMHRYGGRTPTGGEELPADGLATLLEGMKKAGTMDRQRVIEGIETMGRIKFASIDFGFSATNHLARTPDDVVLVTLERSTGPAPTTPAYALGKEWKDVFTPGYVGPTQLVRPTLDANRRAHPDVMARVLAGGYGTQCTRHRDGTLGKECKVH